MNNIISIPSYTDIETAHELIFSHIHQTPVLTCKILNKMLDCSLFFKCENFQKAGAFKFRGASNAVWRLSETDAEKGVTTHSSGNHAGALALAAKMRGIPAYIVMPENAPKVKKQAVASYGAEIIYCTAQLSDREKTLQQVQQRTGAVFVHPYNNFNVICGQATAAKELLEAITEIDIILAPVGGGGLVSGTALVTKALSSKTKVIATEPELADDAFRSFETGRLQPQPTPQTIADGLLTSLAPITFRIIQNYVDQIITVKEKSILQALELILTRMKIVVEPSAVVPVAALLENKAMVKNKRIGVIISGGNLDLMRLSEYFRFL